MRVRIRKPPSHKWFWRTIRKILRKEPKQKVKVKIDRWDTWSIDYTLAQIIHPLLVEFKKRNSAYLMPGGQLDLDDIPGHKDCKEEECWDLVIDELIWTFDQIRNQDNDDQFYHGEPDIQFKEVKDEENGTEHFEMYYGPKHTLRIDEEGLQKHYERINNGLRLFGKYFRDLWW